MKHLLIISGFLLSCLIATAQNSPQLRGNTVLYKGKTIQLNEKNFYIDGSLTKQEAEKSPFVFVSVNDAVSHLTDGTESNPMTLYIAPYVYWIDDPDDPEIRKPKGRGTPYGMEIKCNGLRFYGLSDNPEDVVLASNRGQTQGAMGNFTMFYLEGNEISAENITFGNYCNVDLKYPRNPALNRNKRWDAIVQAQLVHCRGDKYVLRNCRFISRLNLCPFTGGRRTLFDRCYFECTDDALCGTGVYVDCGFTFFSSKPFYTTSKTGAVFYHCDIRILTNGRQYLTKVGRPVTIIDSHFKADNDSLFIGWTQNPTENQRNYQYKVSYNGRAYRMHPSEQWLTVDLTGKKALRAYIAPLNGKEVFNTYNLLKGDDDWDPMHIKPSIIKAEKQNKTRYTDVPTLLTVMPITAEIESGVSETVLTASFSRFCDYPSPMEKIQWSVAPEYAKDVRLIPSEEGTCRVIGTNTDDETKQIVVKAVSEDGLESASVLTVRPKMLPAPAFTQLPKLEIQKEGIAKVHYELDLQGRKDQSLITWYRCTDAKGSNAIEVAVSRLNNPESTYQLSSGDIGYYLMATVAPKHLRCEAGTPQAIVSEQPIQAENVSPSNELYTDFHPFSTALQPRIIPGFWTVDAYRPSDTEDNNWPVNQEGVWYYGKGANGASRHYGLLQGKKGARLLYTPVGEHSGNMQLILKVDPAKTAGQGFGSATGQYLDVCIQFDTRTLTGYGLRITRTVKNDSAVDFFLIKYENGKTTAISQAVSSSCYLSTCTISLSMEGNKLTAHVETDAKQQRRAKADVLPDVNLEATVSPYSFGGVGIHHVGSIGDSATQLRSLLIKWNE